MSDYRRQFVNGTHAATFSTANSALNSSGDALNTSTGGTRTYDNTVAGAIHSGSVAGKLLGTNGNQVIQGWNDSATSYSSWGKILAFRGYFWFDTLPSTTTEFIQYRSGVSESTKVCSLNLSTAGRLEYSAGAGSGNIGSNSDISAAALYRFESLLRVGTTTSNGQLDVAFYAGDSTSPIRTANLTGLNAGTVNLSGLRWGKMVSTGDWTLHVDDLAMWEGHNAFLGVSRGDASVNPTIERQHVVDLSDSNGDVVLTQTGGETDVTITEVSPGLFVCTFEPHSDVLTLGYTVTADGPPVTGSVVIPADNLHNEMVWDGTKWV